MAAKVVVSLSQGEFGATEINRGEFILASDGEVFMRTDWYLVSLTTGLSTEVKNCMHRGRRLTRGERIILTVE